MKKTSYIVAIALGLRLPCRQRLLWQKHSQASRLRITGVISRRPVNQPRSAKALCLRSPGTCSSCKKKAL